MKIWRSNKTKAFILLLLATVAIVSMLGIHIGPSADVKDTFSIGKVGPDGKWVITLGTEAYAIGVADYTCTGVNDNVQFQAAMNALPASGGRLEVLGGTYSFAATVTRAIGNITINGIGAGTYITFNAVNPIFTAGGNNWVISNLRTDAGGINMGATTGWIWWNVNNGTTAYDYRNPSNSIVAGVITSTNQTATEGTFTTLKAPSGRGSTIKIAPYNATATEIAQADVKLQGASSGSTDDVLIQPYILAGYHVEFATGDINLYHSVNISANNVRITGQGNGTRVNQYYQSTATQLGQFQLLPGVSDVYIGQMFLDGRNGLVAVPAGGATWQHGNIASLHSPQTQTSNITLEDLTLAGAIRAVSAYNHNGWKINRIYVPTGGGTVDLDHGTVTDDGEGLIISEAQFARWSSLTNSRLEPGSANTSLEVDLHGSGLGIIVKTTYFKGAITIIGQMADSLFDSNILDNSTLSVYSEGMTYSNNLFRYSPIDMYAGNNLFKHNRYNIKTTAVTLRNDAAGPNTFDGEEVFGTGIFMNTAGGSNPSYCSITNGRFWNGTNGSYIIAFINGGTEIGWKINYNTAFEAYTATTVATNANIGDYTIELTDGSEAYDGTTIVITYNDASTLTTTIEKQMRGNWVFLSTPLTKAANAGNNAVVGLKGYPLRLKGTYHQLIGNNTKALTNATGFETYSWTTNLIKDNTGYKTSNYGSSVTTGAQQTIAHGLDFTPSRNQVNVQSDNSTCFVWQSAAPDVNNIYVTGNVTDSLWHWNVVGN